VRINRPGPRCYTSGDAGLLAMNPAGGGREAPGVPRRRRMPPRVPGSPRPREGLRGRGKFIAARYRVARQAREVSRQFYHDKAGLIRRIGATHHRDRGDLATVHGEVGGARWDVDEVARPDGGPFAEAGAVPDVRLPAYHVDGGLAAGVHVRRAARARRDHDKVQAERVCAGRRAADARLLVPDTPPAVFPAAPDDHAFFKNGGIRSTGIRDPGALSAQVGAGRLRAARPVQPPVDHVNSQHLCVSHP
jgi:hypothetical protein